MIRSRGYLHFPILTRRARVHGVLRQSRANASLGTSSRWSPTPGPDSNQSSVGVARAASHSRTRRDARNTWRRRGLCNWPIYRLIPFREVMFQKPPAKSVEILYSCNAHGRLAQNTSKHRIVPPVFPAQHFRHISTSINPNVGDDIFRPRWTPCHVLRSPGRGTANATSTQHDVCYC